MKDWVDWLCLVLGFVGGLVAVVIGDGWTRGPGAFVMAVAVVITILRIRELRR